MITLDLPPQTVQMIEQIAQHNDELLAEFIQKVPKAELTENGLDIQKVLRDEWH
ncbi:hypothetical protein [Wielerella bovis]|uniref:hypothetical protein n=1 Tax=Wielerella bovis TaxID=2917790 RepID=UPI0020185154|nr:hypothetical protein [Wielerella bovis]MCG7656075.1 hypothetical protein [Wielerella bovis]MCG7658301.1 hypothetical protein [Wielerella bovis]